MKLLLISIIVIGLGLWVYLARVNSGKGDGVDRCGRQEDSAKIKCWQDEIMGTVDKKGLDKAFDVLAEIDSKDPTFASSCHDFVHLLGKKAYELFEKGNEFKISDKTSYCAYGFYHGFMETLVSKKGDVKEAREFCDMVDKQLADKSPSAELACYHGIGHGWTNVHDEKLWGDERAMVYPALTLCEKVTQEPESLKICATGVFDSISIGYYNQAYGLKIIKDNPYWLCREQKTELYKTACYMDLTPAILWLGNYNLRDSLGYLKYVEKDFINLTVRTIAENSVRYVIKNKKDPSGEILTCRNLRAGLTLPCIEGLTYGIFEFGPIDSEYVPALAFCGSTGLRDEEREVCYESALNNVKARYPKEKVTLICKDIELKYQHYCKIEY